MSTSQPHEALFSAPVHRTMRWVWGVFLGFFLVAVIDVVVTALFSEGRSGNPPRLAALWIAAPLLAVWFGIFHFFFRQKPLWGSPEGIEIGRGKSARRVPWSLVSPPEWTWYSFRAPGALRVAFVEIDGQKKRRVYFYASEWSVTNLCRMRDAALARERDAEAPPVVLPPPAAIEFPFAFIPLVIALAALAAVLGAVLRADSAAIAAAVIAVVVFAMVILRAAFSKPPRV